MKKSRVVALSVLILAALALALGRLAGLPYWSSFIIVAVGASLNGVAATIEDDLPGGFNNSAGTATPTYVSKLRFVTIGVVSTAVVLALVALLFRSYSP